MEVLLALRQCLRVLAKRWGCWRTLANKTEPQAPAKIARGLVAALEKTPETDSGDRLLALGEALAGLAK